MPLIPPKIFLNLEVWRNFSLLHCYSIPSNCPFLLHGFGGQNQQKFKWKEHRLKCCLVLASKECIFILKVANFFYQNQRAQVFQQQCYPTRVFIKIDLQPRTVWNRILKLYILSSFSFGFLNNFQRQLILRLWQRNIYKYYSSNSVSFQMRNKQNTDWNFVHWEAFFEVEILRRKLPPTKSTCQRFDCKGLFPKMCAFVSRK